MRLHTNKLSEATVEFPGSSPCFLIPSISLRAQMAPFSVFLWFQGFRFGYFLVSIQMLNSPAELIATIPQTLQMDLKCLRYPGGLEQTHTQHIYIHHHIRVESGCRKWMQSGCRKWMQKVNAKGGCKKQISISIKDECMFICCVCVCSSPPEYLRHFKSI